MFESLVALKIEKCPSNVTPINTIPVGLKMTLGDEYLTAFSVGDQLLWGTSEPLRRILNIML